jgi:hypothetical protein
VFIFGPFQNGSEVNRTKMSLSGAGEDARKATSSMTSSDQQDLSSSPPFAIDGGPEELSVSAMTDRNNKELDQLEQPNSVTSSLISCSKPLDEQESPEMVFAAENKLHSNTDPEQNFGASFPLDDDKPEPSEMPERIEVIPAVEDGCSKPVDLVENIETIPAIAESSLEPNDNTAASSENLPMGTTAVVTPANISHEDSQDYFLLND